MTVHDEATMQFASDSYIPPRVEAVLSADELARDIQYAGLDASPLEDGAVQG